MKEPRDNPYIWPVIIVGPTLVALLLEYTSGNRYIEFIYPFIKTWSVLAGAYLIYGIWKWSRYLKELLKNRSR